MATAACRLCGAGFGGADAAELAAVHATDFHPGSDAAILDVPAPATEAEPGSFAAVKARTVELGLRVVGVKRADLEAAIAAAEERPSGTTQPEETT